MLAVVGLAASARAEDPSIRFEVTSGFGRESDWVKPYLEASAEVLIDLMDADEITPPATIQVTLKKDPQARGIGGWASPTSLGFSGSTWPKEKHREWIVAHELVNLFAAHYSAGGGFPADWWANGRSPFPEYVSCLVMERTGHTEAADARREGMKAKLDHVLYWKLHEKHGFGMFARFFKLLRKDGVDIGKIGADAAPWPAPDRRRSAYTMAYLSLAAGENIADLCRAHGVGRKPTDWDRIHPEIPFPPYEVGAADVDRILEARAWLFGDGADPAYFEGLRAAFRRGDALNPTASGAGSAPIAFEVASDFGAESDWVAGYLGRLAVEFVAALGAPDRAPPETVKVTLLKDPQLGGIGGGASGGAISFQSNVWPAEPFRHWVLGRSLNDLLVRHYGGGGLPSDWWAADHSAFGDPLLERILRKLDLEKEAGFVRSMQGDAWSRALFRDLLADHGTKAVSRLLALLRQDGVDLARIGTAGEVSPDRSLYVAAYLTIATGTNLADYLTERKVGTQPKDWDLNRGPFPVYEITAKGVDRLVKRRERLFGKKAPEAAREKFRRGK